MRDTRVNPDKEVAMADERDERAAQVTGEEDLEVTDEAAEDVRGGDKTTAPTETVSIPYTKPKYEYKP
jgi:hypothetical protein